MDYESTRNLSPSEDASVERQEHKMRLSIDIHSIKESNFRGLIYAKYNAIPSLGIKQHSTAPSIPIAPNAEENFKNSFASYEFSCNKNDLYSMITNSRLCIDLWHEDRFKSDIKVGQALLDLQKILSSPIRQTPQSYVRALDSFIPVDDANESQKRIALLRVIIYLEDLGPVDYLKKTENNYKDKMDNYISSMPIVPPEINTKHLVDDNLGDNDKLTLLSELNNIEYKIIWELETWKKSEEAKFKFSLKAKEIEYLTKIDEEWRRKEQERDRIFRAKEVAIQQVEQKLKAKASELQKREQKLVVLEEELKQRINDTSKQLANKEEEINILKKKMKEERANLEKDKVISSSKADEYQAKLRKIEEEYSNFRREQENSPVNLIKNELNVKNLEIQDLLKKIEKTEEIKEQYRIHFEKMKNEIIRLKKVNENLKDSYQKQQNSEIEQLKIKLSTLSMMEEKENLKNLRNELDNYRTQAGGGHSNDSFTEQQNPFKKNIVEASSAKNTAVKKTAARTQATKSNTKVNDSVELGDPNDPLTRLIRERDQYLAMGIYDETDPLIVEINNQINELKA